MDEHTSGLRESLSCTLLAVLITFMGHFFPVSSGQSFDLPGSESVFGISQDPPMCAGSFLSKNGV